MSLKRTNTSSPECEEPSKRQHLETAAVPKEPSDDEDYLSEDEDEQARISEETGQKGAFPGLSGSNSNELFYGPANDGIDYLRMVRSEARGIPSLLVAEKEPVVSKGDIVEDTEDNEEEAGGYWSDGAYTALPRAQPPDPTDTMPLAQKKYYASLITLFERDRAVLRGVPPIEAISLLKSTQLISFPFDPNTPEVVLKRSSKAWREQIRTIDPSSVQVACIDGKSLKALVCLLKDKLRALVESTKADVKAVKRLGTWVWAILGKCRGREALLSEELSDLRDLAKATVEIRDTIVGRMRKCTQRKSATEVTAIETIAGLDGAAETGSDSSEEDDGDDIAASIQKARERLASTTSESAQLEKALRECDAVAAMQTNGDTASNGPSESSEPGQDTALSANEQKLVILDMIVTIVGEVFGQRDLLELRSVWTT